MSVYQRTPYQNLILVHIEQILDMDRVAHDKYIITNLNENGEISVQTLCAQKEMFSLGASPKQLYYAMASSPWLGEYVKNKPYFILKIPYDVTLNSLILYDLPKGVYQKEIDAFAKFAVGNKGSYVIHRHKDGLKIIFNERSELICFWRSLEYFQFKGEKIKAKILIKKNPKQYSNMKRSRSVVFNKSKIKITKAKPARAVISKVVDLKDNDFPEL